jgi:5-methyltetrahydropteroyltriglutamate--homocysteine methyltransferase
MVYGRDDYETLAPKLKATDKILSLGVVNGRNIWKTNLEKVQPLLQKAKADFGDRLWLAPSCSLLHVPVDLSAEQKLPEELRGALAFGVQKLQELDLLRNLLQGNLKADDTNVRKHQESLLTFAHWQKRHSATVQEKVANLPSDQRANPYAQRRIKQREALNLPLLPTTTIGSFPQTPEIRKARADFASGKMSEETYTAFMREEIAKVIRAQEELDIDVLVHGEPERNDMVEYFADMLDGFAFTENGWVQSYGSRCVKPPVIFGDIARKKPMTIDWIQYAQSLSKRPVKGMLTGPVTMLQWAFVRDDQPREKTAYAMALALRDEVDDLVKAGIQVIQIDEPAFREGLPLKRSLWDSYTQWAAKAFRLSASIAPDEVQIHTHMCYAEFNDIMPAIESLDADVISIETSRSDMELLQAFVDHTYPREIGPGVYDIHSPIIPTKEEIEARIEKAMALIPKDRLWVNPDCGLKTRRWEEVSPALANMVAAAKALR